MRPVCSFLLLLHYAEKNIFTTVIYGKKRTVLVDTCYGWRSILGQEVALKGQCHEVSDPRFFGAFELAEILEINDGKDTTRKYLYKIQRI
jgi:hypothetical protein